MNTCDILKTRNAKVNFLKGLIRVSMADGVVPDIEKEFYRKSAYGLGLDDEAVAEIENSDYKEIVFETTEEKMFFFIQAIQLSWIDNDYCEAEKNEIRRLADELEISVESVEKVEKWVEEGMEWNKKGDELLKLS